MLKDCNFKMSYTTGQCEPKDFFTEALIKSKSFDLGLGFFSSSAIRCLAYGFAIFIAQGGRMRIIINNILSEEDKAAVERGKNEKGSIEGFDRQILNKIDKLKTVLSREDRQFFNCLSYLISVDRLEFIATESTNGGIAHDKYGIFTDDNKDKVVFIGSANFSQTALEINAETITVFTSWKDPERVDYYEKLFNDSWNGDTAHLRHIPLDSVKTHILKDFPPATIEQLLQEGIKLCKSSNENTGRSSDICKKLSDRIIQKMKEIESNQQTQPHFPFPKERQIQIDAYNAWIKNERKGIFAMATGSGKTVTALNCLLKQYQQNGFYKAIIVVPTQVLASQWEQEVKNFNFQNVVSTHTTKDWKTRLGKYTTYSNVGSQDIVVITTYATFNRDTFQYFLKHTKGMDTFLYIADEVHNLGAPSSLSHMPNMIEWRIGLSATPERIYDDIGSKQMYDFFNSYSPQYTYRFTMKQAIDAGILCKYDYYPIFVQLLPDEMNAYRDITRKLAKCIDRKSGTYRESAKTLLMQRKRILHKAQKKKEKVAELLDSFKANNKLSYTFVFVPEGYEPDYAKQDSYSVDTNDIHIIDEYGDMFRKRGYTYHKYITSVLEYDAPSILQSFAAGAIQVLLAMKCLDEGVDIPRADKAIFISSTGNPRQFIQRRGRVLRKCAGKEKAQIWDLIVMPPLSQDNGTTDNADKTLFENEVKRIVYFAELADNYADTYCDKIFLDVCDTYGIDWGKMREKLQEENN